MIFCLPVKKGWQFEQISMWKSPRVERVSMTFPQAHMTLAGLYCGWIPSRMVFLPAAACMALRHGPGREGAGSSRIGRLRQGLPGGGGEPRAPAVAVARLKPPP